MDNENVVARKTSVALLSVVSNTTLVALKLIIGIVTGSVSVISEAIHSGVDLLAAIIALFAVRTSGLPADDDHHFGHHKVENISGTVEALLIFVAAIWIIWEAVHKLISTKNADVEPGLGVIVMLVSAIANIWVSRKLFKVGKETDSVALQADAWHLRTDVYTSIGVMTGLGFMLLAKVIFGVDLHWIDPVAAICVALLIFKAAWDLTIQSGRDLMDASLPVEEEDKIREIISGHSPVVRAFHRLRTRKAGSQRFVQFHLLVDAEMSVEVSHLLNDNIVNSIKTHFPGCLVSIHIEPCDGLCVSDCRGCLLDDEMKKSIRQKTEDCRL